MGRGGGLGGGAGGKAAKKADMADLKQELELDVHKVTVDEIVNRFKSDLQTGLTASQASTNLARFGPNELTPPKKTPEWIKFCEVFLI